MSTLISKIKEFKETCMAVYWNIALIEKHSDNLQKNLEQVHWVKHNYKEGWFADPFILDYNDKEIEILVEEFYYATGKGRISKLVVDRKTYELKDIHCLLQLPTHLSYPAIYRDGKDIYVYPENSESGSIMVYKLNEAHTQLQPLTTLAEEPFTDAMIEKVNGQLYVLTTKRDNPNGEILSIYKLSHLPIIGSENHSISWLKDVRFSNKSARNGGHLVKNMNKIYKVSQDCNEYYGKGLIFYEMNDLDSYRECFSFYGTGKVIGCHTYNEYKDLAVIDGKMYKYHWLANILHRFHSKF